VSGKLLMSRTGRNGVRFGKAKPLLHPMNSKMALYVLTHGVGLIALALFLHRIAPETTHVTQITGLVAGGLCALWGVLGLLGQRRRVGVVLTLIPTCLVMLTQAVNGWMGPPPGKSESGLSATLVTVMFVASLGMLAYVLHAGENPPAAEPAKPTAPPPKPRIGK
jgi:ABC-type Na+ efflux pump permease subunit